MMDVKVPAGKYVIATSGGVDSMTLLDILAHQKDTELIVAHFDHGIRAGSREDAEFVKKAAETYGLKFETERAELGLGASEDEARRARYSFLERIKNKHGADKLITAHHQDDLIETAFLNILRGTGPKGVIAIINNPNILRPLLAFPKAKIIDYALDRHLNWREDPSNASREYLRNYVRQMVIPRLSIGERQELLENIDKVAKYQKIQNELIAKVSQTIIRGNKLSKRKFTMLPVGVEKELMAGWLRGRGIEVDRKLIDRLVITVKTASPGSIHHVKGKTRLLVEKDFTVLTEG